MNDTRDNWDFNSIVNGAIPSSEALKKPFTDGILNITCIECSLLKGTQTAILSGDKLYFWPGINISEEYKVIQLPKEERQIPLLKFELEASSSELWFLKGLFR